MYDFDDNTNKLDLYFKNSRNEFCDFKISSEFNEDINEFLKFLNQPIDEETIYTLTMDSYHKTFSEVWSRVRIHFHASFSTSRRKFIFILINNFIKQTFNFTQFTFKVFITLN